MRQKLLNSLRLASGHHDHCRLGGCWYVRLAAGQA